MDTKTLVIFTILNTLIFLCDIILTIKTTRTLALMKLIGAKNNVFYVRAAFVHSNGPDKLVSTCTYWRESDIVNYAVSRGVSVRELFLDEAPMYRFSEVEPVSPCEYGKLFLPQRFLAKRDNVVNKKSIEFCNKNSIANLSYNNNEDPLCCYWVGIIVTSDTPEYIRGVKKTYLEQKEKVV